MWDWSSTQIDFSQTCWTFDGYNGCEQPGTLLGSGGPGHYLDEFADMHVERIRREDDDIVTIIRLLLTKGLI